MPKGLPIWIPQQQNGDLSTLYRVAYHRFVVSSPFRFVCVLVHSSEMIFPGYGIRFIAINNNVDSLYGDNDFTPFVNLFNNF